MHEHIGPQNLSHVFNFSTLNSNLILFDVPVARHQLCSIMINLSIYLVFRWILHQMRVRPES